MEKCKVCGAALTAGVACSCETVIKLAAEAAVKATEATLEKGRAEQKATKNAAGLVDAGQEESRKVITTGDVKDAADGKGLHLARFVKALAASAMLRLKPEEVAKSWGYDGLANSFVQNRSAIQKALAQGTLADGGAMVPIEYATEFIELLRNATVVRRAGARVLPMGATLEITKQTGAGTAYWGQENTTITASQQTLGKVVLQEKKLTARTEISNDLIKNASLSAEQFVRDDLLNIISIAEDLAFLRGTGVAGEPKGIRNQLASGNVITETTATDGAPTLQEQKKDLNKLMKLVMQANVPLLKCAWFFSARTWSSIMDNVGPGAEGYNSLEREIAERGTLRGWPIFVTEQVPNNLSGGANQSELYFQEMNQVIIGESMGLELMVFPNGGDTGIQKDQTTVRAIRKVDLVLRYDKSGAVISDLTWNQ